MKKVRVHLFIRGDVTGVGFRYWTQKEAKKLDLNGFVRNAGRGVVEAVFEGEEEVVSNMIAKCSQGSEVSFVKKVDVKYEPVKEEFSSFEIRD